MCSNNYVKFGPFAIEYHELLGGWEVQVYIMALGIVGKPRATIRCKEMDRGLTMSVIMVW
jgi:hypothetical protein